jgi:hypothetical protein
MKFSHKLLLLGAAFVVLAFAWDSFAPIQRALFGVMLLVGLVFTVREGAVGRAIAAPPPRSLRIDEEGIRAAERQHELEREQLEGRTEARRIRRAAYLKSRYGGADPNDEPIHNMFTAADALRRKQQAEKGAKLLADVEAEMFRRADELAHRRQAQVEHHRQIRNEQADDVAAAVEVSTERKPSAT